MDARTLSIRAIFGQDRRYLVPMYQRPYVWGRELQWEPLWDDIRGVAERVLRGDATIRSHFIGAVVLEQVPTPVSSIDARLVIDGQQRLTTIQLILEAFCDLCGTTGAERHHKALLKLTRNDDPLSADDDDKFKLWPTTVDQERYRQVMEAPSPATLSKLKRGHPILDAYLYFHGALADWLSPVADGLEDRVDALFTTLRDHVRMVVIDLDRDDDAQLIFETLNARGTPLLPSDLVKNFLFLRARREGSKVEALYADTWRRFDEDTGYWRASLGRGHARRARLDTYLQHYLTLRRRDEVPTAHLYTEFREFVGASAPACSASTHLVDLRRYGEIYRRFDTMPAGSRERLFFERLAVLETTTAYPFLLDLFARCEDASDEIRCVLRDVESFLTRRMVCQLSTRSYNRLFIDLLKVLAESDGAVSARVRAFLLSSQSESARWPDDEEFRRDWMSAQAYKVYRGDRVVMLLEAVERSLRTSRSESVDFKEKLTIEHILPQEWTANWPLPAAAEARERRELAVHRIGNLTLVNKRLNPSLSNSAWAAKRVGLSEHSVLFLNKHLCVADCWDEDAIEARSSQLFERVKLEWPHPSAAN